MNLDINKLSAAIEQSRQSGAVYYEIDSRMKCELFFIENKLRFIVSLFRSAQRPGQLQAITQKRHTLPDRYGAVKIGADGQMNIYAGKTITYIAPGQVAKELENMCEFLTQ